jgi:hypothetical protein
MTYKMMKVFDDMPYNVRSAFFEAMQDYGNGLSNDCYASWYVTTPTWEDDEGIEQINEDHNTTVDGWLLEQGCEPGECVLIEHSW